MTIDSRFYDLTAHLWRGGKYAYFWTPDDGNGEKYSFWLTVGSTESVPKLFEDKDAYFAVNPSIIRRSEHERTRIHGSFDIAALNCLYTEFDGPNALDECKAFTARLAALGIKPACVVFSGGGYHVYVWLTTPYLLDSPEKQSKAGDLQWAFVKYAGGDTGVNDLTRVLRIPGTVNHKPKYGANPPLVTIVEWEPSAQYEIGALEPILQPYIDQRDAVPAHTPQPPTGGVSLSDIQLRDVLFASKNGAMYERLWRGDLSDVGGDHSVGDQKLCNGLGWVTGGDIARMDAMFRQSQLFRQKWETKSYRERTLNNAVNSAQTFYTPSNIDPQAQAVAQAAVNMNGNGTPPAAGANTNTPTPTPQAKKRKKQVTYPDIARDYISRYPDTMYSRGQWYRYGFGVWSPIHDLKIENEMWELLEDYKKDIEPSINSVHNVQSKVRSSIFVDEKFLDNDDQLINLQNGTYSLELRTLLTHDKSRCLTTQLPFDYDGLALAPYWTRYLETTFVDKQGKPDADLIARVQEAIGYSLTTDIRYHVTFWCYGEGANGKGVLFYILEQLAGSSAIPFNVDLLHREQYQLADLAGKRIALCPEADTNSMVEDAIIKALVAGDSLQVRQIRREPFTLRPTVKLWWSMNKLPTVTDTSVGLWRRLMMIPFYADFEHRDRYKRIDDLKERLKDELPGIFNWAMNGLARLNSNGAFTPSKLVDELTTNYREEANTIATFVSETCDIDKTYNVGSDTIYKRYREWCADNGYKAYNVRNFKVEMERLKFFYRRTNLARVYDGLRLKGQGNAVP